MHLSQARRALNALPYRRVPHLLGYVERSDLESGSSPALSRNAVPSRTPVFRANQGAFSTQSTSTIERQSARGGRDRALLIFKSCISSIWYACTDTRADWRRGRDSTRSRLSSSCETLALALEPIRGVVWRRGDVEVTIRRTKR